MNAKKFFLAVGAAVFLPCWGFAALPHEMGPKYKVNLRVNLKGQNPFSINTVTQPGKKSYISEFSDDGMTETVVALVSRKSSSAVKKGGLDLDVQVTRRVKGLQKISERAQIFAPENQEMEFGVNSKGKSAGNLSLAVMAHQL